MLLCIRVRSHLDCCDHVQEVGDGIRASGVDFGTSISTLVMPSAPLMIVRRWPAMTLQ